MIRLTLDLPPSANKRLTRDHHLTHDARAYLIMAAWEAQAQMLEQGAGMYTVPVQEYIRIYGFKGDIANLEKLLNDALNGVAFKDDRLIDKMTLERCHGGERRLEVEIREAD